MVISGRGGGVCLLSWGCLSLILVGSAFGLGDRSVCLWSHGGCLPLVRGGGTLCLWYRGSASGLGVSASGPRGGGCPPLVSGGLLVQAGISASNPRRCLPLVLGGVCLGVPGAGVCLWVDTNLGRHPWADTPLGRQPLPIACLGSHPAHCMLGSQPSPPGTEFLTHACENITFLQLRLRAVKIKNVSWLPLRL